MKKILLFVLMGCSPALLFAQSSFVDANNMKATIFPNGALFYSGTGVGLEVPKGSGKTTVFAANIWVGGYDRQQVLHMAAQAYAQASDGGPGFSIGPWANAGAYTSPQLNSLFNKTWKYNKTVIDTFRMMVGQAGYTVPTTIATYPGSGDTTKGVSRVLAPFHDSDGDGQYTATNADFPVFRGDQAARALFSDTRVVPTNPNTPTNFDFQATVYAYDQPGTDSVLSYTTFVNYRIINRSDKDFDSLYIGHWSDMDLGNYADDFIGSDPARHMFYTYNATNNDDPAAGGYGANPPAMGVVFLSQQMSRFVYYNNDTSNNGDPITPQQKYAYLRGQFKNGSPRPAPFAFDGNPVDGSGSNEITLASVPGDRRGLGVIGPISLEAGADLCIDLAYVYARGTSNLNSVTALKNRVDAARTFYMGQTADCNGLYSSVAETTRELAAKAYPVPFNDQLQLEFAASDVATRISLVDLQGRQLLNTQIAAGETKHDLQTAEFPAGLYFVRLQQGDNFRVLKVVKH